MERAGSLVAKAVLAGPAAPTIGRCGGLKDKPVQRLRYQCRFMLPVVVKVVPQQVAVPVPTQAGAGAVEARRLLAVLAVLASPSSWSSDVRYVVIDATNQVVNAIELDDPSEWEAPSGCTVFASETGSPGDTFDGTSFIPAPVEPLPGVRRVAKSVILSRITDEQLDAALGAMTNRQKERWRSPDTPSVAFDDPEVIGLIVAIGADPELVLAP